MSALCVGESLRVRVNVCRARVAVYGDEGVPVGPRGAV